MAALLMGASLALFLYAAGEISYGDSVGFDAAQCDGGCAFLSDFLNPNDALVTDGDDGYVLVSVSQVANPPFGATGVSGFQKNPISRTHAAANKLLVLQSRSQAAPPRLPGGPVQAG